MNAVEHIGSGIKRIKKACSDYGVQAPNMKVDENWITIVFQRPSAKTRPTEQVTEQVEKRIKALDQNTLPGTELMSILGMKHRPSFLYNYLQPALNSGMIEMTIPDKPTSQSQKYRLTKEGKTHLSRIGS